MAAPTKQGLDYFPFDVDLLDNDDLDFLREKYGVVVNDIYIALLTLLYRKKGYYIPYETEAEKEDCVWYIYKRVRGGKHPVQKEAIPKVIEAIVAQGLFSGDRFNKIITSERAQRTYYSATVERKLESFDIKSEYWLLDDDIMRKLSKKHPYYLYLHPESKSDDYQSKSDDYQSKSDEKPLNKSKVKITSNEVIEVSKKVSNKDIDSVNGDIPRAYARKSYQEVMENCLNEYLGDSADIVIHKLWQFIQHCSANGQTMTNSRLLRLCIKLKKLYRMGEASKMIEALDRAISGGYYDIKDGEGWMAENIKAMQAAGIDLLGEPEDDEEEE